ncbi:MAG: hypothetical protein HA494_03485 [Thaumarchaeota archaeon]|nr:hypothetical protein [Nitrososphaerota archaeon]
MGTQSAPSREVASILSHDEMAFEIARTIRDLVLKGVDPWRTLYRPTVVITSSSEWPEPDFVFDDRRGMTYSFEFKPPEQVRREYLLGLGQAVAYLTHFSHSTLILPQTAENFNIAEYISSIVRSLPLKIAVIAYEPTDVRQLKVLVPYPSQPAGPLEKKAAVGKVFWAFWMDESIHEFYLMLKRSYELRNQPDDIKEKVFKDFFTLMQQGKTYANDGTPRRLGRRLKFSSWFLNYRLPFLHCGLWSLDGKPTIIGTRILSIGDTYGWDSEEFRNALAKAYLINGRHLLLLKYIWDIQINMLNSDKKHQTQNEYLSKVADELMKRGFGRAHRGVRRNLQAMISLWGGGFKILKTRKHSYYFKGFGLVPDWGKITTILQTEYW